MKSNWRTVLSLFVALVFAIAAMPGSMAMPSHQASLAPMAAMHHCDHMQMMKAGHDCAQHKNKDQGSPCKNMAACMGVLACYGMAALPHTQMPLPSLVLETAAIHAYALPAGLSIPPDDRPPIA